METPGNTINIDLNIYADQLRGEISSDLKTLQIIDDAVAHENYSTIGYQLRQGSLSSNVSVPPIEYLKLREISKCFKSIIGSLQDYMDKLIAVTRLSTERIVPTASANVEDIMALLQEKFATHLINVSADRSLNIPRKLDLLLGAPEKLDIKEAVQSYFDIRNGLEHHKGIAKTARLMKYRRIGFASTAGYEVGPSFTLGVGEGLVVKAFNEEISYDEGGNLLITREQLDGIILNLLMFVIPTMKEEADKLFNAGSSAANV
jgi:hypothetical protein